jgi:integrase
VLTAAGGRAATLRLVVAGCLNEAVRAGRIPPHRCSGIRLPRPSQRAEFYFASRAELGKLAAGMGGLGLGLTVWLQRACGLRIGEALAVRRDCFREGGTVLRIHEQVLPDGSLGPLKSRQPGEYRDMPVPARLWAMVAGLPDGYLFTSPHAGRVNRAHFARLFSRARAAAGLPESFTSHALRHGFASACLSAGLPVTDVAKWLGHRDINITFATYGHLIPSSFDRAREVLDREWS